MIAVVRIRGSVGTRTEVERTLVQLGLKDKHSCVIVQETQSYLGMLRRVKDYVAWGEVSEDVLKKMLNAKKMRLGDNPESPYKGLVFRLSPPRKGFRGSIKEPYPRGELGNRGDKINELLERMV